MPDASHIGIGTVESQEGLKRIFSLGVVWLSSQLFVESQEELKLAEDVPAV